MSITEEKHSQKPNIDALVDATASDGSPLFVVGDSLTIELNYPDKNGELRWYDTREYVVKSIDTGTGDVALYDTRMQQSASTNFIRAVEKGHRIKLTQHKRPTRYFLKKKKK